MFALMALMAMTVLNSCEEEDFKKAYDEKTSLDDPFIFSAGYQDTIKYVYDLSKPISDWLGLIKDDTKVCNLSIPGTHDSMTGMGFYQPTLKYIFNATSISQVTTLQQQMENGIRFFDMRPVVSIDTLQQDPKKRQILRMAHGISEIDVTLEQTLDQMKSYLNTHKSEFFIVKMQADNGMESQVRWIVLLKQVLNLDKYKDLFVTNWKPEITVGEMRGKILLMSRYDFSELADAASFPSVVCTWSEEDPDIDENINENVQTGCEIFLPTDKTVNTTLYVQDYYKSNSNKRLENKKKTVIDMMQSARTTIAADKKTNKNIWIINHCSAYTEVSPRGYLANASIIHPLVIDNLLKNKGTVGIMPIDMAGHDYIHCIINGGTPYTSDYLYGFHPLSQSLTNLLIKSNETFFN